MTAPSIRRNRSPVAPVTPAKIPRWCIWIKTPFKRVNFSYDPRTKMAPPPNKEEDPVTPSAWQSTELQHPTPPNYTCTPETIHEDPTDILSLSFVNDLKIFNDNFVSKEICNFTNIVQDGNFENLESCVIMPTISYAVLDITINLLIDSGSTSNFISNRVVKKLNLKKCHLQAETEKNQ